ncbi:MAG: asparagine synthase (glutamine-hydrolyzing) [Gemmatimonadota bacterium]
MCGIVGLLGRGDEAALARMTARLQHRGPDDSGLWTHRSERTGFVGLGNRRLAIRDLSPAGHMPMRSADGELHLTYNGELYNAAELRRRLEGGGARFRSTSDTEVVLHALDAWGTDAVAQLDGMFAFAAVDLGGKRFGRVDGGPALLLARDPLGIKPLYVTRRSGSVAFASEAKAFVELPDFDATVDPVALQRYLALLWVPEPDTLFAGVDKLPPAHWALAQDGGWRQERYWRLRIADPARPRLPERAAVAAVRDQLEAAVGRQMVSDVPVGAFLSAGLDSTAIVAAMVEHSDGPVRTFTITFPAGHRRGEATLDDPAVARRTAERFGCRHQEIVVEPDVAASLPGLVWSMDDAVADPAILTAFEVCRAAGREVTVLLSGVGGDEVFGGYRKYAVERLRDRYRRLPAPLRRLALEPLLTHLPALRGTRWMGWTRLARKFGRSASLPPVEAFLRDATYLDEPARRALLTPGWIEAGGAVDPYVHHRALFEEHAHADPLEQRMAVDLGTFLPSLNLDYNDKMSMASSVEVRVPLLDRPLVEFAFQHLAPDLKLHGGLRPVTKYVLRRALAGRVPDEVLHQPKAGFGAPHDHWLTHDLAGMVDDLLSFDQIRRRGILRPEAVRTRIEAHRAGDADLAYPVWQLLTLELWMRAFVDGERPPLPAPEGPEPGRTAPAPGQDTT